MPAFNAMIRALCIPDRSSAVLPHPELTACISQTFLWTDSMTVLTWLTSQSCRFKVFMGTRVSEVQELTALHTWQYVDTTNNPSDELTRGKTLAELAAASWWIQGPAFLRHPPDEWPSRPITTELEDSSELKCFLCPYTDKLTTQDTRHHSVQQLEGAGRGYSAVSSWVGSG